jgi:hypothetical protein
VPQKDVCLDFDGGELSSDAGWLLLALANQQLGLTRRLAAAVEDPRDPERVDHSLEALFQQRCFQVAQGYEDANDAQLLRHDPLLKVAVGRTPSAAALAGQSTLSRWENAVTAEDLDRLEAVLQQLFVEQIPADARRVVLDLDPYDDPAHGQQQGVLFNGYYDCHCYLPLLFCGTVDDGHQRLIGVVLRGGTAAPTEEATGFLEDLVPRIRAQHPDLEIVVRGDSGFGVPAMITCCRCLNVRFCCGKAKNAVLLRQAESAQARAQAAETRRPARGRRSRAVRVFDSVAYRAKDWEQAERVVVKGEFTLGSPNPRFVVTDLKPEAGWTPHAVYRFYCARGDRENRIKEFKLEMAGGRLSCMTFLANQFRLIVHAAAFLLYQAVQEAVRKVAPHHALAAAQVGTLRSRLMKVAARVRERRRVIRVHLGSSFPEQRLWRQLAEQWVTGGT